MRFAWGLLILAGVFEVVWAVGFKYSDGLTRLGPTIGAGLAVVASLGLLAVSMKTLALGTAYAVWTAIGVVGTTVVGIALFGDSATAGRLACIGLIVGGTVGLHMLD